jgi:hypothetical protein
MSDDPPAVQCLQALERDMQKHINYRPRADEDPVEIYVLDDHNAFAHFLKFHFPELPPRRAFFLAQGSRRVVYTYSSPRLEEDLRHEATHALLRGAYGDLPLWLDEGLAEYFEKDLTRTSPGHERVDHLADDLRRGWAPNITRLEALADIREMTPRDYREAWAWVDLFLNGPTAERSTFLAALETLKGEPTQFRLEDKGANNERLVAHIKDLQSRSLTIAAPVADSAVRLQDKSAETPAVVASQRGFWRRLRTWIGL